MFRRQPLCVAVLAGWGWLYLRLREAGSRKAISHPGRPDQLSATHHHRCPCLWRAARGARLGTLRDHLPPPRSCAYHPAVAHRQREWRGRGALYRSVRAAPLRADAHRKGRPWVALFRFRQRSTVGNAVRSWPAGRLLCRAGCPRHGQGAQGAGHDLAEGRRRDQATEVAFLGRGIQHSPPAPAWDRPPAPCRRTASDRRARCSCRSRPCARSRTCQPRDSRAPGADHAAFVFHHVVEHGAQAPGDGWVHGRTLCCFWSLSRVRGQQAVVGDHRIGWANSATLTARL